MSPDLFNVFQVVTGQVLEAAFAAELHKCIREIKEPKAFVKEGKQGGRYLFIGFQAFFVKNVTPTVIESIIEHKVKSRKFIILYRKLMQLEAASSEYR